MDRALSLAVGAIAIDPSAPTRVWVGTGEGNQSGDSYSGVGVYLITAAESAAPVLSGPFTLDTAGNDVLSNVSVAKILVHPTDPNTVFVATVYGVSTNSSLGQVPPLGLYRSQNALAADPRFSRLAVPAGAGTQTGILDAVFEPGDPDHLLCTSNEYFNASLSGVFRTTTANTAAPTFTRTLALPLGTRASLAANLVGSTVNVALATGEAASPASCTGGESGALRKSADGGQSWSAPLSAAAGFCGGQCWYDIPVAIDPGNAALLYLGGAFDGGGCAIDFTRSTDGGASFSGQGASDVGLHADAHAIAVAPSAPATIYLGNDGGIFKSIDHGQTWTSLNNGQFSATEFYSLALHPTDRQLMIGGTQDNGTPLRGSNGLWLLGDFGDGGYTVLGNVVNTEIFDLFHTFYNVVGAGGFIGFNRAASAACAASQSWAFRGCGEAADANRDCDGEPVAAANGISCNDSTVLFYPPMVGGPGHPNTLYFGTDRLYRSANRGDTMTAVSQQLVVPSQTQAPVAVSAIGIAPGNDLVRLVGLANGRLFLTVNGGSTLTDVTGPIPALFVARIVIDPTNPAVAYVSLDGYPATAGGSVWKTGNLTSGHPTWQAAGSGIPGVPTNALVIDPANPLHLYAGTDIGVYHSADGAASWAPFGSGLPRVPVLDLGFQGTQHVLRAATHGRGIWETQVATPGALGFFTLTPCRVIDTRGAAGALGGPALSATAQRTFAVAEVCGIPTGATAVSANITITGPTAAGFLTLAPAGQPLPLASTINFAAADTRANNAVLRLSADGSGSFVVLNGGPGTVQLIVDVNGYFE
jgi:hypothetical protein